MLIDFRLKVFYTVAKSGSFSKAARELGITQPAVSQNIAELEQQIGDFLFERLPSGIKLTAKGGIMLAYAEKILHLYHCLNTELVPSDTAAGAIRIAANPIAVRFILPKAIERFRSIFPRVEVILMERADEEIEGAVRDGIADLGVTDILPEGMKWEPFVSISVSDSGKSVLNIYYIYSDRSLMEGPVKDFILTSKTAL